MLIALVLAAMAVRDLIEGQQLRPWIRILSNALMVAIAAFALRQHARSTRQLEAQRQLDEQARAAAVKFSGILAIAADAIIVIDSSNRILHFNHGAEAIFGYSAPEAEGQPLSLLIPERVRSVHEQHIAEFDRSPDTARQMGHRRAVSGLRKNGREFPAEAAISKLDLPGAQRIYTVVLRDITERKRLEEADHWLSNASGTLAASLDPYTVTEAICTAPVPVLADACLVDEFNDKGQVVRTAHAGDPRVLSALLTLTEEYPAGRDETSPFARALRGEQPERVTAVDEAWLAKYGGEESEQALWRGLEMKTMLAVPLRVGTRIIGALTLLDRGEHGERFDAEMRRVVDEFARRAAIALDNARLYTTARRATNARDEVLSVVSHDLRNPIGAIAMCARILREKPPTDEAERKQMLSAITDAAGWMQRLIRDLLDVTSIDAGRLAIDRQPSSLSAIVGAAVSMLRGAIAERSIDLRIEVSDRLPTLVVDESRIVQVVANLLGNAIKFSEPGSRVTVRSIVTERGVVTSVEDTGIGIAPDVQARIFNRFWQVKPTPGRGNGLGLAIAHGIVEAHGGRIWVESTPGKGSTFAFSLPGDD